jgi:DNA recombination protein RmuC
MNLWDPVFELGGRAVALAELAVATAALVLALLLAAVILAWRAGRTRRGEALEAVRRAGELEVRLAEMAGQMRAFSEAAHHREAHIARTLDARLDQVSHRLGQGLTENAQRTGQSLQMLHERLAVIDSAQANLTRLSSEMLTLRDILANKQSRGAYGQARMEAIIRDGLHSTAYSFQAILSNGTRPDCLITLPDSPLAIVIDAKFPLEAFNALKQAEGETAAARQAAAQLRQDVSRHIRDIAQKYLIPGETHETAIMFVPSESIYADLYEQFEDVVQKAHRQRVVLASPNILMLLVQTMQAIFKDGRMREQAHVIQKEVALLLEDVGRLRERVIDLQRHFGQAGQDIDKLLVSSQKIASRGARIEQVDLGEEKGEVEEAERPVLLAGKRAAS